MVREATDGAVAFLTGKISGVEREIERVQMREQRQREELQRQRGVTMLVTVPGGLQRSP